MNFIFQELSFDILNDSTSERSPTFLEIVVYLRKFNNLYGSERLNVYLLVVPISLSLLKLHLLTSGCQATCQVPL